MAVLLPWGVLMRRNSAAHRRVLILATICISDAGFSRFVSLFLPAPTGFLGTYLFYEGGNVLLMLLMFLWDWKRNRIMKQFLWEPCSSPLWACRPRASTSTRLGNRSPAHGWRAGRGTCCKAGRLRVGAWPLTSAQSFKVRAPCPRNCGTHLIGTWGPVPRFPTLRLSPGRPGCCPRASRFIRS